MPRPFHELTLEQFEAIVADFPWRRRITEVHVHHTFRPNHADFAARAPVESIEAMFRFHTVERGFADIAQHVTIDPRGIIWTGRDWNRGPASATGFNGNANAGPFMFEMIGNFDRGQDPWQGAQQAAADPRDRGNPAPVRPAAIGVPLPQRDEQQDVPWLVDSPMKTSSRRSPPRTSHSPVSAALAMPSRREAPASSGCCVC